MSRTATAPPTDKTMWRKLLLRAELSGVLAWVVRGCRDWWHEGLGEPEEVRAATAEYRVEQDVLATFMEERCVAAPNASAPATPLYHAYKAWCEEAGERVETQKRFGMRLAERGFKREKVGVYYWLGIGLRYDGDDDPGPSGPSGPKNDISSSIPIHEAVMRNQGPKGPKGPDVVGNVPPELVALLADPPEWLTTQLTRCSEDERVIKPTCSTIAYEVYGTASRWEEVKPVVERWLEESAAGAPTPTWPASAS